MSTVKYLTTGSIDANRLEIELVNEFIENNYCFRLLRILFGFQEKKQMAKAH